MMKSDTSDIIDSISKFSQRFKLVALSYALYLIIPPLTLLNLEEGFVEFQNLISSNPSLAESKVSEIVNLYLLNGLSISLLLLILCLTMLILALQYSNFLSVLEMYELKKTLLIIYIWVIYTICYSIINAITVVGNIPKLTSLLNEGINSGYLNIGGLYSLDRTLFILHETLYSLSIIVISYTLKEIPNKFEILEDVKKPSKIMLIGALILLIEIYIGGTGIGSILVLISFIYLGKSLKKIVEKIS